MFMNTVCCGLNDVRSASTPHLIYLICTHPQCFQLHALLGAQPQVGQLGEQAVAGVARAQAAQPRVQPLLYKEEDMQSARQHMSMTTPTHCTISSMGFTSTLDNTLVTALTVPLSRWQCMCSS